MTEHMQSREAVATYARLSLRGEAVYAGYQPRSELVNEMLALMPTAHVVIVSGAWCPDCRREVPKMARILDGLPSGWTVELLLDDDDARERLGVRAIPTFVVQDAPDGRELGRIIERPGSRDGLEGDLLAIARARTLVAGDAR
jgi:hypothetical protein